MTDQATDSTKPAEREELLPCPFCGEPSDLTVHVYGNGDDDAYVQCRECTTCGPDGGDRAGAIAKWNHRALLAADGKAGGEVMNDEAKAAVKLAYGHLWHVNNEPAAPIDIYDTEKAAYEARRQLRGLLTDKERGEAINHVGDLIGRYENPV